MGTETLQQEIEQFLYKEAALFDERRFDEWLELLADDVLYWVPVRETREQWGEDVRRQQEMAYMEEDKRSLELRVKRLGTGLARAEEPPSRTRHLVTNVRIVAERGAEVEVHSYVLVFQSRYASYENFYIGKREDLLRKVNGVWKIARRKVILDHALLPRTLSVFF